MRIVVREWRHYQIYLVSETEGSLQASEGVVDVRAVGVCSVGVWMVDVRVVEVWRVGV